MLVSACSASAQPAESRATPADTDQAGDPFVKQRVAASRASLQSIPCRPALRDRLEPLLVPRLPEFLNVAYRGELLFAVRTDPPRTTPRVVVIKTHIDPSREKLILDLGSLEGPRKLDWIAPAHNGRMVAIALSGPGGQTLRIHETDTGVARGVPIKGPLDRGLAWDIDATGFYYARQTPGEPPTIFWHPLGGHPDDDEHQKEVTFPRGAAVAIDSAENGDTLAWTLNEPMVAWFRRPGHPWTPCAREEDQISRIVFGVGEALYFITRRGAPRGRVGLMPIESPSLRNAELLMRPAETPLKDLLRTSENVMVLQASGGGEGSGDEIRLIDLHAQELGLVAIPSGSFISAMVRIGDEGVLVRHESLLTPRAWSLVRPNAPMPERSPLWGLRVESPPGAEVVRVRAGETPMTVIRKAGAETGGGGACVLMLGDNATPTFDPARTALLERGVAVALAPSLADAAAIGACVRALIEGGIAREGRVAVVAGGASTRAAIEALRIEGAGAVAAAIVGALGDGPVPVPPTKPLLLVDAADAASIAIARASDRVLLTKPTDIVSDAADRLAFLLNVMAPPER